MTDLRHIFLDYMYPAIVWSSKVHSPWSIKEVTVYDLDHINKISEWGDVLLSFTKGEFTNLTIPSKWKHTAMIVDKGFVVEAVGTGVKKTDLREFCLTKDRLCLIRPKLGITERMAAAAKAITLIGLPYDFKLDYRVMNQAFYCSELPHWCYEQVADPDDYKFVLRDVWGSPTIKPDDYLLAKKHFDLLWSTEI